MVILEMYQLDWRSTCGLKMFKSEGDIEDCLSHFKGYKANWVPANLPYPKSVK